MPASASDTAILEQAAAIVLAAQARQQGNKGLGFKHDAPGNPSQSGFMHGPTGLLTYPGIEPDIFHTVVGFRPSILSEMPAVGSVYMNPMYEVITGVRAGSGSEPTELCGPAPIGGLLKGAKTTAPFGLYKRDTREFNIQRLGQRVNRADPVDVRIIGTTGGMTPWTDSSFPGDVLTNELSTIMFERAVAFDRLLRRQIWAGNPTNNAANGAYREFAGFDLQVNTGWKDSETGTAIAALDPDVKTFGKRIDGNCDEIVNKLTYMLRTRRDLASRTGMLPVRWAFVMPPDLFYELTKCWPCSYMTNVCTVGATNLANGVVAQIDNRDIIDMRDGMRRGQYLLIDGEQIQVIQEDGMTVESGITNNSVPSGCRLADIFLIPFSVMGGRSVTYLEYFNYTNPSINSLLNNPMVLGQALANGAFFETVTQTRGCFVFQAEIQPRLVIRTPWLAGRLTDVIWCPLQTPRSPFPDDPYFVNGGESSRPGPSLYSPWV